VLGLRAILQFHAGIRTCMIRRRVTAVLFGRKVSGRIVQNRYPRVPSEHVVFRRSSIFISIYFYKTYRRRRDSRTNELRDGATGGKLRLSRRKCVNA